MFAKEISELIDRHAAQNRNMAIYGGPQRADKGFFLMFVKRDDNEPEERRIEVSTFGQAISIQEVAVSMEEVVESLTVKANTTNYA